MRAIDEITQRLAKYPQVKYEITDHSITVFPLSESGFEVSLFSDDDVVFSVFFNGWHEDFESKADALNCFSFGLSADCRLKECRRGGKAYKWTVESRENDQWISDSTTGLFFFPFWREKKEIYLQNTLITD